MSGIGPASSEFSRVLLNGQPGCAVWTMLKTFMDETGKRLNMTKVKKALLRYAQTEDYYDLARTANLPAPPQ